MSKGDVYSRLLVDREHVVNDLGEVGRDRHEIDAHLLRNAGDVVAERRPQRVVRRRRSDQLELSDWLAVRTDEPEPAVKPPVRGPRPVRSGAVSHV